MTSNEGAWSIVYVVETRLNLKGTVETLTAVLYR